MLIILSFSRGVKDLSEFTFVSKSLLASPEEIKGTSQTEFYPTFVSLMPFVVSNVEKKTNIAYKAIESIK